MADVSKIVTVTEIKTSLRSKRKVYAKFVKEGFTLVGLPLVCWNLLGLAQNNNENPPRNVGDLSVKVRTKFQITRRKCHKPTYLLVSNNKLGNIYRA
jgi:hypothetical protein